MYDLFEDTNLPKAQVVKPGQIDLLKRTYQREVLRVIDYYGSHISNVKNEHILNRLIVTGCPSLGYDLQKFLSLIKIRAPFLADNFQFTSASLYGKIFDGDFYGGAMEIIIHDTDDFDEDEVYTNWRNTEAIRVLSHPFTDYKLMPPFGQQYTNQKGLLVTLSINISKLMVQYKGFMDSKRMIPPEERINIGSAHFIKMHVLPNILRSHVEFVLYNRLKDMFYTLPNYESITKNPFAVIDYTGIADDIAEEYLKRFENKGLTYSSFFQNIPGIFKENILDSLFMPDEAKTKQVWWALFLTRLEDQFFATHLLGDQGINNNKRYHEKMITNCKWFLRDNTFKKVVSGSIYSGYLSDMAEFIKDRA